MAKFNYDEVQNNGTSSFTRSNVGYFNSLKDDNNFAIVRFAYKKDTPFDTVTVHKINVNNMWRNVSCLREVGDNSKDSCPLCAAGEKISYKVFIKLVEYTKDENGNVVATPKIWERPSKFVAKLKTYIAEYGDICDMVFKVVRHGKAKATDTEYELIPVNQTIYPESIYVKNFSDFETLDLSHHSYMEKTKEEMEEYLKTGNFPSRKTSDVETTDVNSALPENVTRPVSVPTQQSYVNPSVTPTQTVTTQEETPTVPKKRIYTY